MYPSWEIPHSWDCWEFTCSNSEPVIYTGPDVQSSSAGSQTDVSPATWAARGAARCSGCTKITHQNQTQCEDQESKNRWFFSIFTSSGPFIKFKISATTESFLFSLSIFFFNSQLLSSFNLIKKKKICWRSLVPPLMWNQFRLCIKVCCRASNRQRFISESLRADWAQTCAPAGVFAPPFTDRSNGGRGKLCHTFSSAQHKATHKCHAAWATSERKEWKSFQYNTLIGL